MLGIQLALLGLPGTVSISWKCSVLPSEGGRKLWRITYDSVLFKFLQNSSEP